MTQQSELDAASEPAFGQVGVAAPATPRRRASGALAWAGLSLFVLVVLGHLCIAIAARTESMSGRTVLYSADRVAAPGERVESRGLIYEGRAGLALSAAQAALTVVLFAVAALAHPRRRIIALALFVLWALYWAVAIGRVMVAGEAWTLFGPWFAIMMCGVISAATLFRRTVAPVAQRSSRE